MAKLRKLSENSKGTDQLQSIDTIDFPLRKINGTAPNVRKVQAESESIRELQESLKRYGQLQPVGISQEPGPDGVHELLYGFRRFAAVQSLGWDRIKAVKIEVDPGNREAVQLVENIHREDMTDGEIAQAVAKLKDSEGNTAAQVAESLGKTESWVKKRLHHASMLKVAENLPELDESSTSNFLGISTQIWDAVRKVDGPQQSKAVRFVLEQWSSQKPLNVKTVREYIKGLKATPPKSRKKDPPPIESKATMTWAEWLHEHKALMNAARDLPRPDRTKVKAELERLAESWFP